ncbi:MAG: glucan biosynthesis protein [Sphingobium sp.]
MTLIDRRALIAASGAALLLPRPLFAKAADDVFSWDRLIAMAQRLTRAPFRETPAHPGAARIGYDAHHQARFRDERTIWGDLPGDTGVRLFPLSATAPQPVDIAIVENGRATPLRYDPSMFETPAGNAIADLGADAGYAGFRVMNAARDADWLSFLGASYFRSAGAEKQYGLSARAIAINTSLPGKEEFPRFTRFWLERTGTDSLTVFALLDGASVTGAFRFVNRLTAQGVTQDVTAALFPRRPIEELGLMAMTSMFWYDQADKARSTDWRPEIHDSDMLAIRGADGLSHCRPLTNPAAPGVSPFPHTSPAGFGLLQRDRDFDHYQDDGVFYDRRPSLWASPATPLGPGAVRLYAFPTDSEYVDNIAAYWTPDAAPRAGRRIDARYRLDWSSARTPGAEGVATVANIWRGAGDEAGEDRLVVDFTGVPANMRPDIAVELTGATLVKKAGYPVIGRDGLFRVVLDIGRAEQDVAHIQAHLQSGNRPFSEIMHYAIGA